MTILNIRGHSVEIDIESELSEYDINHSARWTSEKLITPSPFRTDNKASFFVNLSGEYAGTWADKGAYDDQYARGGFVALIAHLRSISFREAEDYLLEKYGVLYEIKPDKPIRIPAPNIRLDKRKRYVITDSTVTQAISPYLISRGIGQAVQERYGIGYNSLHNGFVAIPWHYADTGEIANVKYRSTSEKRFFFEKGAEPIKRLVYGLWQAREATEAIVVEAEIDVLSFAQAGYSAIAVGGAHMSREQADLIKRSRIERLYLGGDNDEQGRKMNKQIKRLLGGHVELFKVDYGRYKDANEALLGGVENIPSIIENGKRLHLCNKVLI